MDNKTKITWIAVRDIMDHPDNPRKDLGDLGELTESIRLHGIMQNLIVMDREEMLEGLRAEYEKTPSQIYARTMDRISLHPNKKYVMLLGHRRLEAAALADLETVPCIVYHDLTLNDQISLMLLENMQRNNLSIIEEAESFQMMLDLGDTVKTVAEKTGFSKSTVRHRAELAKLDRRILKKAMGEDEEDGFQLKLTDLVKLEKIDDITAREQILDEVQDGDDIEWKVDKYLKEQKKAKNYNTFYQKIIDIRGETLKAAPKGFSAYNGVYNIVFRSGFYDDPTEAMEEPKMAEKIRKLPEDAFFAETYSEFIIAKKTKKSERLSKEEQERKEREKKAKEIRKLTKAMLKGWITYLMEIVNEDRTVKSKVIAGLAEDAFDLIERLRNYVGDDGVQELARFRSGGETEFWRMDKEEREKLWRDYQAAPLGIRMLIHLAHGLMTSDLVTFYGKCNTDHAETFAAVLGMMETTGYKETDENRRLINGTHALYGEDE